MRVPCLLLIIVLTTAVSNAQVLQLPTIQTFGTQGTVVVPDRGGISLGSINRAAIGSTSRGVPILGGGRRAIGSSNSHAGASVHATIIDLDEWDRQIRQRASTKSGYSENRFAAPSAGRSKYSGSFESISRQHEQHYSSRSLLQ